MQITFRLLVVVLLSYALSALAMRAAPKVVPPVIVNSVEFSAPPQAMGFVMASDVNSHKELWRQRIYSIEYDSSEEKDVQEVYITSLLIKGDQLVVTNEKGDRFVLDIALRKVSKIKPVRKKTFWWKIW
jgi:hypothetical protein